MSSPKAPSTQTVVNKTELPAYIQEASQSNIAEANRIASQPWTGWTDSVVSPWNADMNQAADKTRNMAFDWQPQMQAAEGGLNDAGAVYKGVANAQTPNVDAFMNPRMKAIYDEINRQGEIQRNQINRGAAARRMLGGTGHAVLAGQQMQGQTRAAGLAAAESYDKALGAAQAQQQIQMAGAAGESASARSLADLAGAKSNLKYTDLQALMSLGTAQREDEQANLNQKIQNFYENRDWDVRGLNLKNATLSSVPYELTQTQTSPYYPKSPLAGAFGGAMSGAGLGMSVGGGPWGAAAGGVLGLLAGGFT